MTSTLQHRGPDDEGAWISPDGRVALGHRRLSIIDLSPAGHQPMTDPKRRLWISFNGEIYNYQSLREELRQRGHDFATASDTEVILEAYREWGDDSVKKLNGMFAFALFDMDRQRLFLARDRAGEKPLFYSHSPGKFFFASELKALMKVPEFSRVVDPLALNQYLAFGYVPGESCIFKGVRKLPQGCAMVYDLTTDAVRVSPYWTLPEPLNSSEHDEEELLEELETLLLDSVRLRLIADVPVGIMLSGGIDSSLITAMAARISSKPVRTFTISFPGYGTHDESPHARLIADYFGTDHVVFPAEQATVDILPQLARQYDEPMADSSMVPTFLVSRLIRREATVALGGDGGDELFGGYFHYRWIQRQELIRRVLPAPLRHVLSALGRALPVGVRGRNYLVGTARDIDWSIAHANLYFDFGVRQKLLTKSGIVSADARPEEAKAAAGIGNTAVQRAMAADFRGYMVDDILVKVDRASMLTSLEVRAPLLDPRIIEFAFSRVPDQLRAWNGERKVLLRKLARRVLPKDFDVNRKQGFAIPLTQWFRGDWGRYMREVLLGSNDSIFDRRAVESVIRGQERGLANTQRIFALTIFELWRREYHPSF